MPATLSKDSYAVIEGVWKNFRFRRILPEDYDAVLDHIAKTFVRDEPTCKLMGYSDELAEDFTRLVTPMLADNMSFLAEDVGTGEIAGVRVTFSHTKETNFDDIQMKSEYAKLLVKLIEEVEEKAQVKERLGIDSWAEFFIASTAPKYRQIGLAGEFYRRSVEFLKRCGFRHALVIVSSPYTRMATDRQGFEEYSCVQYKDFLGLDGKPAFPLEKVGPEHFACVKVKVL